MQANAPEFWRIDVDQPLRSQLQGRAVIEFPTLLVRTSWEDKLICTESECFCCHLKLCQEQRLTAAFVHT